MARAAATLPGGQAIRGVLFLALQHARVEVAVARIVYQTVLQPVEPVAGRHHRRAEHRQLGAREVLPGIAGRGEPGPQLGRHQPDPVVGGSASDDAVVVVGVALGLHQGVMSALRAADEVGEVGVAAVVGARDRLAGDGRLVLRAIPEVDQPHRVSQRPASVEAAGAGVAVVGGHRRVAPGHRSGKLPIADGAGRAPGPYALEPPRSILRPEEARPRTRSPSPPPDSPPRRCGRTRRPRP